MTMRIMAATVWMAAALAAAGCAAKGASKSAGPEPGTVAHLAGWMEGNFDNVIELKDPVKAAEEEHFPIEVHLKRIPQLERTAERPEVEAAFYIQQAAMTMPMMPYRQRVYLLHKDGERLISEVWTIKNEGAFVGAHKFPERAKNLNMRILEHKGGCDVVLAWDGSKYVGGTEGNGCESTRSGASYATAQVTIFDGGFSSWDRGFNAAGEQVWGAEKRGYTFRHATAESEEFRQEMIDKAKARKTTVPAPIQGGSGTTGAAAGS